METDTSVLDLLLRPELPDVRKIREEKQLEVTRMTSGEIDELYAEIQGLPGYLKRTLTEIKNA